MMVVANKIDLEPEVENEEIKQWASEENIKLMFASAKNGQNVEEIFMSLSRMVMEKESGVEKTVSFSLKNSKTPTNGCC